MRAGSAVLTVLLAGAFVATAAGAGDTVQGRRSAWNNHAWTYRYDAAIENDAVRLTVRVDLVPSGSATKAEIDRVRGAWKAGAEAIWGGRFALRMADGRTYPVFLRVDFRGPTFDHSVVVRPGTGRADELHWRSGDSPALVAHEIGHMLGAYDDYEGGGQDPQRPLSDPMSVMKLEPVGGVSQPRHYATAAAWLAAKSGAPVEVVPMGDPQPTVAVER